MYIVTTSLSCYRSAPGFPIRGGEQQAASWRERGDVLTFPSVMVDDSAGMPISLNGTSGFAASPPPPSLMTQTAFTTVSLTRRKTVSTFAASQDV